MGFWSFVGHAIWSKLMEFAEFFMDKMSALQMSTSAKKEGNVPSDSAKTSTAHKEVGRQKWEKEIQPEALAPTVASPGNAYTRAKRLGTAAIGGITGLNAMAVMTELGSLGQMDTQMELVDSTSDIFNIKWAAALLPNAIMLNSLKEPLGYWAQQKFRPFMLDLDTAHEALGRGIMKEDDFKVLMSLHGYHNDYYPYFKELSEAPIRPNYARYMSEAGMQNIEQLKEMMINAGFNEDYAEILSRAMPLYAASTFREDLMETYRDQYIEGRISKGALQANLEKLGNIPEIVDLVVQQAETQREFDHYEELADNYMDAYEDELLTENEFWSCCRSIGMAGDRIDELVLEVKTKINPKPVGEYE